MMDDGQKAKLILRIVTREITLDAYEFAILHA